MLLRFTVLSLALFLIACPDNLYDEPKEYEVSGVANFGSPLVDSNIKLFSWKEGLKGDLLAQTKTNQLGEYKLKILTRHKGPILVELSEGVFTNLITAMETKMGKENQLSSFVLALDDENKSNINVWTTLAVEHSTAKTKTTEPFEETLTKSLKTLSNHFGFNINEVENCDVLTDECKSKYENFLFSLSNLGFHQLADNYSIGLPRMLKVLLEDISDGILDGKKNGKQLYLNEAKENNLDGFLLRKDLSSATHQNFQAKLNIKKTSFLPYKNILAGKNGKEGFYSKLSLNIDSELFNQKEEPKPFNFDPDAYEVLIDFNSASFKHKDYQDDFEFKDNQVLDVYDFKKNNAFSEGFVFAHGLITNNESHPMEIKFSSGCLSIDIKIAQLKWYEKIPLNKKYTMSFSEKEEFCRMDDFSEYRILNIYNSCSGEKKNTLNKIKYFDFSPENNTVGEELLAENGFLIIEPKTTILAKWYETPEYSESMPFLSKGNFPTGYNCYSYLYASFLRICKDGPKEWNFREHMCSHIEFANLSFLGFHALKEIESSLSEIDFSVRLPGQPETEVSQFNKSLKQDQNRVSRSVGH